MSGNAGESRGQKAYRRRLGGWTASGSLALLLAAEPAAVQPAGRWRYDRAKRQSEGLTPRQLGTGADLVIRQVETAAKGDRNHDDIDSISFISFAPTGKSRRFHSAGGIMRAD